MNKQALSLAIFIAGAYPAASSALGLGDIESNSHLNQPLRAKIDLLSAAPADASQIQVRLAPPEVFNRVGVARPEFLGNLRFTPTVQGGKPVILVSSDTPIQEPFVNFLLEVSWPQGQLLKEYTVMLDPPVLMQPGNTVAGEAAVRAEPKATGNVRRPAREPSATSAAQQPAAASRNRTYRVKSGDTLFRVASRLQRSGVSNDQMMMALFRANPGAFIDKNINNLRAGALMKAPSGSEISAVPQAEARRQIRQQNAEWRELRKSLAGNTVPQQGQSTNQAKTKQVTQANATPAKAANNATDKARLEVLGAKTGEGTATNAAVAAGTAKLAEIEKQLALANESLAARQNENNELKSRVTDLESMLNKKNRLLELRDSQLADLQKQLAANGIKVPSTADTADAQGAGTQPVAVTPEQGKDIQMQMANVNGQDNNTILRTEQPTQPAPVLPTETVTKTNTALGQNTSAVATPADTATSNTSAVPLKPAIVPVTPAADAQKAVKPSPVFADQTGGSDDLLGLLTSPLALKIGAGSLALLLLLWLLGRRRKPDGTASGQAQSRVANLDDDLDVPVVDEPFDMNALERELEKADKGNTYGVLTASAKAEEDPFGIGGIGAEPPSEANEDDCLTEANVYIAYGLYQQAETELKKCIERYPDKPEYRHKLLECYFVANNRDAFDSQAQQFAAMPVKGKDALWQSVVEWGRKISPDNRLYQGDMSQTAATPSVAATVAAALGGVAAATAGAALASSRDSDDAIPVASAASATPNTEPEDFNDLDLGDLDFDDIDLDKLLQEEDVADIEPHQLLPAAQMPDLPDLTVMVADKAKDETLTGDEAFELGELDDDLDLDFDLEDLEGATKPQPQSQPDIVAASHDQYDSVDTDDLLDFDLSDLGDNATVVANPPVAAVEPEMTVASSATHLNLHLDNETGIKRILPKDTFYAPISDEDKDWLGDIDDALSFLDFPDEEIDLHEAHISTKLDLARAYLDMGDIEGARSTLEEVMVEGNDDQRREAEMLLHQTG